MKNKSSEGSPRMVNGKRKREEMGVEYGWYGPYYKGARRARRQHVREINELRARLEREHQAARAASEVSDKLKRTNGGGLPVEVFEKALNEWLYSNGPGVDF